MNDSRVAEELIRTAIDRNGVVPHTVHADRGTSMTSKPVAQFLTDLGVTRFHSRPKTSNDNPYSEAHFKTIKYSGDFPERFGSLQHARDWCDGSLTYHNHEHRHSAMGLHIPVGVHFGTADLVRQQRAVTLAQTYAAHPNVSAADPTPRNCPRPCGSTNPA
ncbi:integrase core domain-containing protein [Streptomyces sp. NPDC093252]|uniref:integrase core domain-containing protein n=1 Tax=Streptomyces sp. NPDC093252 TaxID=3154980 RepID=UPI0034242FD2